MLQHSFLEVERGFLFQKYNQSCSSVHAYWGISPIGLDAAGKYTSERSKMLQYELMFPIFEVSSVPLWS